MIALYTKVQAMVGQLHAVRVVLLLPKIYTYVFFKIFFFTSSVAKFAINVLDDGAVRIWKDFSNKTSELNLVTAWQAISESHSSGKGLYRFSDLLLSHMLDDNLVPLFYKCSSDQLFVKEGDINL